MSISCDCSVDIGDSPEFYIETFPVSRKVHKCCECGEDIKSGQKHHKFTGRWDGFLDTYRTCMVCYNIREHYCPHGYIFGGLAEAISECLGFDYREIPDDEDD